jgi:hypothetical protein
MDHTVAEGFLSPAMRALVLVGDEPIDLLDRVAAAAEAARGGDNYSKV